MPIPEHKTTTYTTIHHVMSLPLLAQHCSMHTCGRMHAYMSVATSICMCIYIIRTRICRHVREQLLTCRSYQNQHAMQNTGRKNSERTGDHTKAKSTVRHKTYSSVLTCQYFHKVSKIIQTYSYEHIRLHACTHTGCKQRT